ncbi:MAG: DUF4350 domain-containing protein [Leptolyngbyaceae cyanobacterium CRU_2_3]|nr:DUF4350 domain-containing protein [Leptolyngbyaceae cyanobacterium CRU_2_3]
MNFKNRWLWLGAIALLTIVLLSLFSAPRSSSLNQGSTYSRSPDGYGAWFAYMQAQGIPVQRWQKPIDQMIKPSHPTQTPGATEVKTSSPSSLTPLTLIQINNGSSGSTIEYADWIEQGNVLVRLGVRTPPTQAPFRSSLTSPVGKVTVETSRRFSPEQIAPGQEPPRSTSQPRLSDAYGSVVWEEKRGKGRVIFSSTAFLAANAYQDAPGNFKFLAQLLTEPGYPIWVDEYLHGYKDQDQQDQDQETSKSLIRYLAQTPFIIVALQAVVGLLVLIWSQNRRLGAPIPLVEPAVDNSQAYIQALAEVLQKANSSDFVVETITKAEQLHLQRSLGLGTDLLDASALSAAWHQQTGQPAAELQQTLALAPALAQNLSQPDSSSNLSQNHRPNPQELLTWLRSWQAIRQKLEN